ncbi:MAG: aminotransferase class III-fold pyridoxal phosphate-dependent enzyme [Acidimicrobiaceae bacterium]|nr:aminotransferase class III-fold pyridoxal phosphate-dependent enzyme [Acidimicrobiaceae bacterium]MDE0497794.1 aminotransferase class III-fold pyridoxal phosphate-dependent enzyme [Acidimicrobiaceae bacterium]
MDSNALIHPYSIVGRSENEFIRIVSGEGVKLTDDAGNEYIDGLASLWLCQIGHGNRTVIDAIGAQLDQLATYNTFEPFSNGPAVELAEMVRARSQHPDGRVFLACSGSEAVDTALKFARRIHHLKGDTDRQIIVRRSAGYHGVNVGGTSVQGGAAYREGWGDLMPHVVEIPNDDVEPAAQLFAEQGERIAAVISEPIQGAGGVVPPPSGYFEGLRRLCTEHGALLIFDEVICGFGRTGSWFAGQTFGVAPDMFTFAKGVTSGYIPLAGVLVSRDIADLLEADETKFMHGYTYSGHPTACAAGIANIGVIESEGLVDRAHEIGDRMEEGFLALQGDGMIDSYRGLGGIWACDLGRDATEAKEAFLKRGVITRSIGNALAFCPPLIITDDEIGQLFDRLDDALRATAP